MSTHDLTDRDSGKPYRRPMVPLAIALMTGIALGGTVSGYRPAAWGIVSFYAAVVLYGYFRRREGSVAPLVLVASLGYLSIQPILDPQLPENHLIRFVGKAPARIVGIVCDLPSRRSYRTTFIVQAEHIGWRPGVDQPAVGRLRVTAIGPSPHIRPGDRMTFHARLRKLRNFNNPGRFNYVRYMACRKVRVSAYVRGGDIRITAAAAGNGLWMHIDRLRLGIASWIDRHAATGLGAGVLKALLVGDRTGIPSDLRNGFNRTGLGHLLAISGLHIGIIAAAAFFIFQQLFSFSPLFLRDGWVRKGAAVLAMIPVIGYGLVAGMSPSTQRAVLMVLVFLLATLANREQDSINTLAFAALLLLVIDPGALYSISFQLSFSAVAVILYGLRRLNGAGDPPQGPARQILKKLLLFMVVSFLATMGTLPLTLFYFNTVSTVGVLFNLLAVPLIGFGAVPMGLLGLCLIPFCESAAATVLHISEALVSMVILVIQHVDDLPTIAVEGFAPTVLEIILYYVLLWGMVNLRQTGFARILVCVALFAGGADACYWVQQRFWHRDFRVTVIDVGQGSASLLEFPKGRCMLIDGGGASDNTAFDVGQRVVGPLLRRKRIGTVDTIVLSHPNSDHLNGLLYILGHFNVHQVWTNGQGAPTAGYRRFTEIITTRGIDAPEFDHIPKRSDIGGVILEILYPPGGFHPNTPGRLRRNTNNNSIVIKATFGDTAFLFPGDIMAKAEQELIARHGEGLRSNIFTAPHHGSRSSSTVGFLKALDPEWVIVSSGRKGGRYFPHPTIIGRYRSHRIRMLRTDTHGAVSLRIDPHGYSVSTYLPIAEYPR